MTDSAVPQMSIGRTLLVQLCVTELLSVLFFVLTGAGVIIGAVAPLCAVTYPLSELPVSSALRHPFVIVVTFIAVALLAITLVAWLRFRSRAWAHSALALYTLLSMYVMLGFAI